MHDVLDGAQLGDGLVGEAEVRRGEVADQRFRPHSPGLVTLGGEPLEPGQRLPSHQHPHLGVIVRARICDTTRRPINPVPPVTT